MGGVARAGTRDMYLLKLANIHWERTTWKLCHQFFFYEGKKPSFHQFSASLYSTRKRALPPMSDITGHILFSQLHSLCSSLMWSFLLQQKKMIESRLSASIRNKQNNYVTLWHSATLFYKSRTGMLADVTLQMHLQCDETSLQQFSLTFSVTPRTLMASLTCWWMFFCISSSHTHRPRLHTAMHLNERRFYSWTALDRTFVMAGKCSVFPGFQIIMR